MAFPVWTKPPIDVVQDFEARQNGRGPIGALILWAVWAVESLYYLEDLTHMENAGLSMVGVHSPAIKDIAHARWATGTSITSLDLCAAALGRECCKWVKPRELDLRDFDPTRTNKNIAIRRASLPTPALAWINGVFSDDRYKEIHGARNPLTHSRLIRNFYISHPTKFVIRATGNSFVANDLVILGKNLAKDHVDSFLAVVEKL